MFVDGLAYGYVADRVLRSVGDTADDVDRLPDVLPARGTVTFRPVVPIRRPGPPSRATFIVDAITCRIDQGEGDPSLVGLLVDPAGHTGNVALPVGRYDVSYSLTQGEIPSFSIEVKEGHTEDDPLWLYAAAPLQPTPAERWVVNEQVYTETLEARDAALDALRATWVDIDLTDGRLVATRHDGELLDLGDVRGPQGKPGTGLNFLGALDSPADLPTVGGLGDGYFIADDLWVWVGESWLNVGPVRGPKGDTGDTPSVGPFWVALMQAQEDLSSAVRRYAHIDQVEWAFAQPTNTDVAWVHPGTGEVRTWQLVDGSGQ